MDRRRFSAAGEISASSGGKGAAAKEWLSLLLAPLTILGVLAAFWMIYQAALIPAPVSPMSSAPPSSASPSEATFPPELLSMANAVTTALAPTPTRTPEPYQTPTPLPILIYCGINSTSGQTCTWPQPTIVATEMPVCLTPMPLSDCVWRGNISSTPVEIAGAGKGT